MGQWVTSSDISCGSKGMRMRFYCDTEFPPLTCGSFTIRIDCHELFGYEEVLILSASPLSCSCDPLLIVYSGLMFGTQTASCADCSGAPGTGTITG